MAVYQEKAAERIKNGLRKFSTLIEKAIGSRMQESDTRKIVTRVLTDLLGWDEFENLTGEVPIKGSYADFVLKNHGDNLAVIEVKQVGLNLNEKHLRQAKDYAVNEGIEWVYLTNGNVWKIYRIVFVKNVPDAKHVFTVQINDTEMKPAKKTELLYLLSEEAFRKNELSDYYERRIALSGENLASRILSNEVLDKIRIGIKASSGHKVTNAELAEAIIDRVLCNDVKTFDCEKTIRQIAASENKQAKKPNANGASTGKESLQKNLNN